MGINPRDLLRNSSWVRLPLRDSISGDFQKLARPNMQRAKHISRLKHGSALTLLSTSMKRPACARSAIEPMTVENPLAAGGLTEKLRPPLNLRTF
jgi:hypothetical protein